MPYADENKRVLNDLHRRKSAILSASNATLLRYRRGAVRVVREDFDNTQSLLENAHLRKRTVDYTVQHCSMLTCTILCFVLVLDKTKTKTKLFLVLQWYFDLSKPKVLALVFVLPKPK